ncbi:prolipoprotein diacylglyceryl transferase [Actinoplanes regularis]|uniref:Phosphatidylglycerol--prolipoprotein diacylglyceryl transferase n=1 Tax=Actinoplanes regularis TaxID=52697 RepID=A0A238WF42_9ACTN|nr:prolipoprotein diacylglyceryl transferase [Actinoplanes regularis]GIE84968.1 prolipoprotein diacylglyceryl transferase [Actinoplanes regularis]SNR44903.1 prolipoprotein diacylglyceryl transferase [Actinoplanes regularis]
MNYALIPSPTTSVWHLGPFPIRAYALCIIVGMVVATLLMEQRLRHRGVAPWVSLDMVVWAVPFGIIGARVYHLITSPQDYFGSGGDPIRALYIWEGGLGIWGAVAGGALGAWIAARQIGLPLSVFADSLAPALPVAQAIGRFGNWFNNELYGKATTLPWGLQIHTMDSADPGHAATVDGEPLTLPDLFHPTFLYEAIWDLGVAGLVWLLDRKFKFGRGRAFALYVMAYTVGRCWIEMLRTDTASHFFGVRLNVFTSIVVFLGAAIYFVVMRGPRAYVVPVDAPDTAPEASGIGQVDVSEGGEPVKTPVAYQVVSEERFLAYQQTGVLPPETPAASGTLEAPELPAVSETPEEKPAAAADDEAVDRPVADR